MLKKAAVLLILLLILLSGLASAEHFSADGVASMGYSETQWLSNENSRALLICTAVRDYCDACGVSFKKAASMLLSNRSYIKAGNGLELYIANGDNCLRIDLNFEGSAISASAERCGKDEIDAGSGKKYTVSSDDCRIILSN